MTNKDYFHLPISYFSENLFNHTESRDPANHHLYVRAAALHSLRMLSKLQSMWIVPSVNRVYRPCTFTWWTDVNRPCHFTWWPHSFSKGFAFWWVERTMKQAEILRSWKVYFITLKIVLQIIAIPYFLFKWLLLLLSSNFEWMLKPCCAWKG